MFQLTAARRRLGPWCGRHRSRAEVSTHSRPKAAGGEQVFPRGHRAVSTHSRPKAAGKSAHLPNLHNQVSTHSRPKAAGQRNQRKTQHEIVSTHSRPKAAGPSRRGSKKPPARFNSQPPEGGWLADSCKALWIWRFNSQPPEGGWHIRKQLAQSYLPVSTHSRPKAAGNASSGNPFISESFNSQPPEGGWLLEK